MTSGNKKEENSDGSTGSPAPANTFLSLESSTGFPYIMLMHTVIRTGTFLSDAKASDLSEEEQDEIVATISKNPLAGDIMKGTGGCRKIRFAGREKGKSGGYRTVHYFAGDDIPVLLLALINKGESANLSKAERNALQLELKGYANDYRDGVAKKLAQMRAGK